MGNAASLHGNLMNGTVLHKVIERQIGFLRCEIRKTFCKRNLTSSERLGKIGFRSIGIGHEALTQLQKAPCLILSIGRCAIFQNIG